MTELLVWFWGMLGSGRRCYGPLCGQVPADSHHPQPWVQVHGQPRAPGRLLGVAGPSPSGGNRVGPDGKASERPSPRGRLPGVGGTEERRARRSGCTASWAGAVVPTTWGQRLVLRSMGFLQMDRKKMKAKPATQQAPQTQGQVPGQASPEDALNRCVGRGCKTVLPGLRLGPQLAVSISGRQKDWCQPRAVACCPAPRNCPPRNCPLRPFSEIPGSPHSLPRVTVREAPLEVSLLGQLRANGTCQGQQRRGAVPGGRTRRKERGERDKGVGRVPRGGAAAQPLGTTPGEGTIAGAGGTGLRGRGEHPP